MIPLGCTVINVPLWSCAVKGYSRSNKQIWFYKVSMPFYEFVRPTQLYTIFACLATTHIKWIQMIFSIDSNDVPANIWKEKQMYI